MNKPTDSNPTLIDVTLRTGQLRINNKMLPEQAGGIAHSLQHAGISHIEISHGVGFGAFQKGYPGLCSDADLLRAAKEAAPNTSLGIYLSAVNEEVPPLADALPYFSWGKIGVDYRETPKSKPFVTQLKKDSKQAFVQLHHIHHGTIQQTVDAVKQAEDFGADAIFLTDSFGSMKPEDVQKWIEGVSPHRKVPLGFHARNHTGWALANSLAAQKLGVKYLDAAVFGMGPGAGITPTELLVAMLQKQNLAKEINLAELFHATQSLCLGTFHSLPFASELELLFYQNKLDYYPQDFLSQLATILEIPLRNLLFQLKAERPEMSRITRQDLEDLLAKEGLKLDVVLEYLRTGQVPGFDTLQ